MNLFSIQTINNRKPLIAFSIGIKTFLLVLLMPLCLLGELDAQCSGGTTRAILALDQEDIFFNNEGGLGSSSDFDGGINVNDFKLTPDWFSGLWVGGRRGAGGIPINASQFEVFGNTQCFWPGPINQEEAEDFADPASCSDWDIIFEVAGSDIASFIEDFSDNGQIDEPIPLSIQGWPARGNPLFFEQHGFTLPLADFAPFEDVDNDGIYNPNAGDYPDINNASHGLWWLMNTNGNFNSCNNSENLIVEFQVMAYTFDSFDQSLFYDIDIVSKDVQVLDSVFLAYWVDVGSFSDVKLIGSMPEEDYAFFYSDPDFASALPNTERTLLGLKQLRGAFAPRVFNENNELVYPASGVPADTLIEQKMAAVKHYYRSSSTTESFETDPATARQYYNIMQGKWRTGQDQVINGVVTPFAFPGNPADQQEGDFSMCNEDSRIEDIRVVVSSGPFRIAPGSRHSLSYVLTRTPIDTIRCADTEVLTEKFDLLERRFNEVTTSTQKPSVFENKVEVFPNPAFDNTSFVLDKGDEIIEKITVFDLSGRNLLEVKGVGQPAYDLRLDALNSGTYFFLLASDKGNLYSGKFVKL